ncbi:MAG: hypothetical protein ACI4JD_06215 [Ruminococcus sp.]
MKTWQLCLAGAMLAVTLAGCSEKKEDTKDYSEADLPYGATMLTDTESGNVPITYDRRFFSQEEAKVLSDYFYALETKDEKLLDDTTLDLYTDFVTESMYQNFIGLDGLVVDMSNTFAAEEDVPYEIKEVEIKSFYTSDDEESTDLANLYTMLRELSGESDYVSQHIEDGKCIIYNIRTDTDGTVKSFESQSLFLIKVDGAYYVCS